MFNKLKKTTAIVTAGALMASTFAFHANLLGNGSNGVVFAAEAEDVKLYDAASAVNYSTILGRGVDFGIVADKFTQMNHMQTTFAVKTYANDGQNNDINLIATDATAQVLIGGVDTSAGAAPDKTVQIGSVSGKILNIECC